MPIAEGDAEQKPVEQTITLMATDGYRCLCGAAVEPTCDAVAEHVRFDCPKVQRAAPAPVWPPNAEAMTLGQVEALAKRLGAAAATFNEARALLGAAPVTAPTAVAAPTAPLVPGPVLANGASPLPRPPTRFNDPDAAAELQMFQQGHERQRIVQQNRDDPSNFPPGIANAMRGG